MQTRCGGGGFEGRRPPIPLRIPLPPPSPPSCTLSPAEEHQNETAMNTRWHTELRAMKTVVAGAVGADCGEANLTHCGPPPPSRASICSRSPGTGNQQTTVHTDQQITAHTPPSSCISYALVQATVQATVYFRLGGTCQLNPVPAEGREGNLTYPEELWRRLRRRIRRRAVALRWTDGTMCAAAPPRDTC